MEVEVGIGGVQAGWWHEIDVGSAFCTIFLSSSILLLLRFGRHINPTARERVDMGESSGMGIIIIIIWVGGWGGWRAKERKNVHFAPLVRFIYKTLSS